MILNKFYFQAIFWFLNCSYKLKDIIYLFCSYQWNFVSGWWFYSLCNYNNVSKTYELKQYQCKNNTSKQNYNNSCLSHSILYTHVLISRLTFQSDHHRCHCTSKYGLSSSSPRPRPIASPTQFKNAISLGLITLLRHTRLWLGGELSFQHVHVTCQPLRSVCCVECEYFARGCRGGGRFIIG